MDDGIVRKRLATGESSTAALGPRRLCSELLVLAGSAPQDVESKREVFKLTLAQYQYSASRLHAIESRCREELEYYEGREAASAPA